MAHPEQRQFFERLRGRFPGQFYGARVIDCGSLDVNGTIQDLFIGGAYLGVDIHPGRNVHLVHPVHTLPFVEVFDTVVSGEMLEHSEHWVADMTTMYRMLRAGGLLALTMAGPGRPEHGTRATGADWGTGPDYYRNLSPDDVRGVLPETLFTECEYLFNPTPCDTYFWGIKR